MANVNPILSLLPGPVHIVQDVRDAFLSFDECHRSQAFEEVYSQLKGQLRRLSGTNSVELFMGSGTLANDVIACQLKQLEDSGLVLCNGEFGERLVKHAYGAGLDFDIIRSARTAPIEIKAVKEHIQKQNKPSWIWAVHCETSTGILNDIEALKLLCGQHNAKLCLDCISSIGLIPLDLHDVFLASGTSSKGLASFAGLSMVFHNHSPSSPSTPVPRYLDLYNYSSLTGVPFTASPNLMNALLVSVDQIDVVQKAENIKTLSDWLRDELQTLGIRLLVPRDVCNPAVITLDLSGSMDARRIGDHLRGVGILVNYESSYLLERNWLQVCMMGKIQRKQLTRVLDEFKILFAS